MAQQWWEADALQRLFTPHYVCRVCVSFPLSPTSTCFLKRSQLTVLELQDHLLAEPTPLVRGQERAPRAMEVPECRFPPGIKQLSNEEMFPDSWFVTLMLEVGKSDV